MSRIFNFQNISFAGIIIMAAVLSFVFCFRIDLTSDKRFSIAQQTKNLLHQIDEPIDVNIYLTGNLNASFFRLQQATGDLFAEFAAYCPQKIKIQYIDPTNNKNIDLFNHLIDKGLDPTNIYERTNDGRTSKKMIFPFAAITYKNHTLSARLLKNIAGNTGEENINISVENLEFEITDILRQLTNNTQRRIVFIEGHNELSEAETYDISKALSTYFFIDRGKMLPDASILDGYSAVIVAGAQKPFSESEKFIIDQYIMHGGCVVWLLDGVELQENDLTKSGIFTAKAFDVNLGDMFFHYGIRIEPILVQDMQCVNVPVNIAPQGQTPQFEQIPFFFTPLLIPNPENVISKNLNEIRAQFPSTISLVGDNNNLKFTPLLFTSDNTHIIPTPTIVNLGEAINPDKSYFNTQYLPVAFLVEGTFNSDFTNRMPPQDLANVKPIENQSVPTKQIFIAARNIIRNETNGIPSDSTTSPLGYDRFSEQIFGNKDFLQNAVLYITGNEQWLQLRSRTFKLRLLNKNIVANNATFWEIVNIAVPIALLGLYGTMFLLSRKRKYVKKNKKCSVKHTFYSKMLILNSII
ncbi:MAG: gliding motility-associated ABC transporter substrate-binding protein GldG [Paludibacter sp.]|nr:gliding motility-associated ABC transporter substrate-binding protein GldG [Paludibacter sp.]